MIRSSLRERLAKYLATYRSPSVAASRIDQTIAARG